LTYNAVKEELGEKPLIPGDSKKCRTRGDYFRLLFLQQEPRKDAPFDIKAAGNQGWQNKLYIHGVQQIMRDLGENQRIKREFLNDLRGVFDTHCLCIPITTRERWLAGTQRRLRPGYIGFEVNGKRGIHTWSITERDLSKDCCWNWSAMEVMDSDVTHRLARSILLKGVAMPGGITECFTPRGVVKWKQ